MCLILLSKTGKCLDKNHLETGWSSNYHGASFAYIKDKKLLMEKGFFKFDEFYNAYLEKCPGNIHVIHERFASIGLQNKENCHPFVYDGDEENPRGVLFHNGFLGQNYGNIKDMSDTYSFVQQRIIPFTQKLKDKKWWTNPGFKWFFQEAIGTSNKIVFIDNSGHIEIYNEKLGEWIEKGEIWASNTMYKIKKTRYDDKKNGNFNLNANWGDEYEQFAAARDAKEKENLNKTFKDKSSKIHKHDFSSNNSSNGNNTLQLPVKIQENPAGNTNNTDNIWDVTNEELDEIDAYLAELNDEN